MTTAANDLTLESTGPLQPVTSRSELLSLLSEASELEHGLACSYLYTAITIKEDLREGGLTWQHLQDVRRWAAQIYFVASEEMLHLAQAWNLLAAIGGTPYYFRPNFPQNAAYYPLDLPLCLEPLGIASMQRFVFYELPRESDPLEHLARMGVSAVGRDLKPYRTVGDLYARIQSGFETIPESELFLGDPTRQVGRDLVDFPDIVRVVDRASAIEAITVITEQGEGTKRDRDDCHYGVFRNILAELTRATKVDRGSGPLFAPARNTIRDPIGKHRGNYGTERGNLIEDPYTQAVALLFDDVYGLMLRMLQYVFSNSTENGAIVQDFARLAIQMMPTVILPLGSALTLLPAGPSYGDQRAGPAFGMTRHVGLPIEPDIARRIVREQAADLKKQGDSLAGHGSAPRQLKRAVESLNGLIELSP